MTLIWINDIKIDITKAFIIQNLVADRKICREIKWLWSEMVKLLYEVTGAKWLWYEVSVIRMCIG